MERQPFAGEFDSPQPMECDAVGRLIAGAAAVDVTPDGSVFLFGYPHQPRFSTGTHDPLLASALYLRAGEQTVVFVSVDTIWLSKQFVAEIRRLVAEQCNLQPQQVMIAATHTHSGPVTVPILSNFDDPVVPPPDAQYLSTLREGVLTAITTAVQCAEPAEIALVEAECADIGGNRHDPNGPTITQVPILAARASGGMNRWLGLMYVNRVHPTVLHEDSRLISADFPGMCRRYLQSNILTRDCPVLSHLGTAGNQSPRFVARSHTFAESERLGNRLGAAIESALKTAVFRSDYSIDCKTTHVELPPREMPSIEAAELCLVDARKRLAELKERGAEYGFMRTAECAVFGAEETVSLANAAATGALAAAQANCQPAEIQLVRIDPWCFVGWPGEVFAEFALELRQQHPNLHVITLANGELQGYLVTADALRDRTYEAANSIFASPSSGHRLVEATLELLERHGDLCSVSAQSGQAKASL